MRGYLPIILGVLLAATLIIVTERSQHRQIAPVAALQPTQQMLSLPDAAHDQRVPSEAPPVAPPTRMPPVGTNFTVAAPGQHPYIPILMYHYVRTVDAEADPLGYNLSVTPEQLRAQLEWLHSAGYEGVRMQTVADCLRGAGPCPARAVALTFDDGYMDAYTAALPLLKQYGYPGTFYIVTKFVGQSGYMGWDELHAMRDAGMEIGSHSVHHLDLTTLGPDELRSELTQARTILYDHIGVPIVSFCYPSGRFNTTVAAVTAESGYTSATTTQPEGAQDNRFLLSRLRIAGDTSLDGFRWMVQAYLP